MFHRKHVHHKHQCPMGYFFFNIFTRNLSPHMSSLQGYCYKLKCWQRLYYECRGNLLDRTNGWPPMTGRSLAFPDVLWTESHWSFTVVIEAKKKQQINEWMFYSFNSSECIVWEHMLSQPIRKQRQSNACLVLRVAFLSLAPALSTSREKSSVTESKPWSSKYQNITIR